MAPRTKRPQTKHTQPSLAPSLWPWSPASHSSSGVPHLGWMLPLRQLAMKYPQASHLAPSIPARKMAMDQSNMGLPGELVQRDTPPRLSWWPSGTSGQVAGVTALPASCQEEKTRCSPISDRDPGRWLVLGQKQSCFPRRFSGPGPEGMKAHDWAGVLSLSVFLFH